MAVPSNTANVGTRSIWYTSETGDNDSENTIREISLQYNDSDCNEMQWANKQYKLFHDKKKETAVCYHSRDITGKVMKLYPNKVA